MPGLSPKITVVGVGAIGGWIAARLAIVGERVSALARGDTLGLVRAEGLRLDEQGEEFVANVDAADNAGHWASRMSSSSRSRHRRCRPWRANFGR